MTREPLPDLIAPIVFHASVLVPQTILYEAALSFLGVGTDPGTASWGQMLSDATATFDDARWTMVFPGAALLTVVLAFNLVGDGLRDALRSRRSK